MPADGPAVSVILVVRDGGRFIAAALDSVLRSVITPLEILVIDGGSTDRTVEIARAYPLARVIPQNGTGIAGAYNQGIALAQGEFVAFISHDDIWEPGKLDRQVAFMRQNPALGYTVTLVRHFLDAGATIPPGFRAELLDKPVPGMVVEALVACKSTFAQVGPFDESFAVGEDTDWFARAHDAGVPMAVLPQVLVYKRIHGSNSSLKARSINAYLLRAARGAVERKRQARGMPDRNDAALTSVVVPCYNAAAYLAEAVESILRQDAGPLEIIVIDDGSTDSSADVARGFGACVRYERQPNAGASAARNRGIAMATGACIAFLDADDVWPDDSLNARIDALRAHPWTQCIFGAVEEFVSPGTASRAARPRAAQTARLAGTMLIERSAFLRVGLFDPTLKIGEMLDWVARAQDAELAMRMIDAVVLRRRIHGDNMVTREKARQGDYLRALRSSLERRRVAAAMKG